MKTFNKERKALEALGQARRAVITEAEERAEKAKAEAAEAAAKAAAALYDAGMDPLDAAALQIKAERAAKAAETQADALAVLLRDGSMSREEYESALDPLIDAAVSRMEELKKDIADLAQKAAQISAELDQIGPTLTGAAVALASSAGVMQHFRADYDRYGMPVISAGSPSMSALVSQAADALRDAAGAKINRPGIAHIDRWI